MASIGRINILLHSMNFYRHSKDLDRVRMLFQTARKGTEQISKSTHIAHIAQTHYISLTIRKQQRQTLAKAQSGSLVVVVLSDLSISDWPKERKLRCTSTHCSYPILLAFLNIEFHAQGSGTRTKRDRSFPFIPRSSDNSVHILS